MRQVGRNDPCPCGSGKKYKRCCLGSEQSRAMFLKLVEQRALPLLQHLARFAEHLVGASLEKVAREEFPFWSGPVDAARGARVVEHLIFDQRIEGFGRRAVDQFALERGPQLTQEERSLLSGWAAAQRRLYRVEQWSGGLVRCKDALIDDPPQIEVMSLQGQQPLPEGAAIALRALTVGPAFVCLGEPLRFPDRSVASVAEAVKARHLDFVRSRRIVSLEEFLRLEPTTLDKEAAALRSSTTIILPGR